MKKKVLIVLLTLILGGCIVEGNRVINPDNINISYMGRVDFSNPLKPRFDWPGVTITMKFTGRKIGVILEDGGNDYNVFIDGKTQEVLVTSYDKTHYMISDDLSNGSHTIVLNKRTEGYDGVAVFGGFIIDEHGDAEKPDIKYERKIEFIGDSVTVGYGVEGLSTSCESERKCKNNYLSYASILAGKLNAEYNITAISGRGVVRNYNDKNKISEHPFPDYYDKTLMNDMDLKWDFSSWVPDIVFINLGTNDFTTRPYPDEKVFIEGYIKLLDKVRKNYPKAAVYCIHGPKQPPPFNRYIIKILDEFGDKAVKIVNVGGLSDDELGCDWHPNIKAQQRTAEEIYEQIRGEIEKR